MKNNRSSAIFEIKSRLNIADIIRRYVDLKNVGGRQVGVCPFHQETKGSFNVNETEGFFHCFGCGASGDIFDFYSRINGFEFKETLEALAAEAGVRLESWKENKTSSGSRDAKETLRQDILAMHLLASEFFVKKYSSSFGVKARDYTAQRGLDPELVKNFALGYSPPGWHELENHLIAHGYSREKGVAAGLLSEGEKKSADIGTRTWDRFRDRLMFPIKDLTGRILAFGARTLDGSDPKYLNSAESPVYKKGEHLFGLDLARRKVSQSGRLILTEGYIDVITLHAFGYGESCGVLGTAMTSAQARRVASLARQTDLIFDGDPPGRKAALKAARMILTQGALCRVVNLPEGEDVDSFLRHFGRDGLEELFSKADDGLNFCLKTVKETFSAKELIAWTKEFINELADDSLRAVYLPKLMNGLNLDPSEMRHLTIRLLDSKGKMGDKKDSEKKDEVPDENWWPDEKDLLTFIVRHEKTLEHFKEIALGLELHSSRAKIFWQKLLDSEDKDPLLDFDEEEKELWAASRTIDHFSSEEIDKFICISFEVLALRREKRKKNQIILALREASAVGDTVRVDELLLEMDRI